MTQVGGEEQNSTGPRPLRSVLFGTTRRAIASVVAGIVALSSAVSGIETIYEASASILSTGQPSDYPKEGEIDIALPLSETPMPGIAGSKLGWGDASGGRIAIPYTVESPAWTTPSFNRFVDVPSTGDSRRYMQVRVDPRPEPNDYKGFGSRDLTLSQAELRIATRIVVSNDTGPSSLADCQGGNIGPFAKNSRVRVATYSSADGRRHVIRSWVTGSNTDPGWVTDAVLVRTDEGSDLAFDPAGSRDYIQHPLRRDVLNLADAFTPGGVQVGIDGSLGACWENRQWLVFQFRVVTR